MAKKRKPQMRIAPYKRYFENPQEKPQESIANEPSAQASDKDVELQQNHQLIPDDVQSANSEYNNYNFYDEDYDYNGDYYNEDYAEFEKNAEWYPETMWNNYMAYSEELVETPEEANWCWWPLAKIDIHDESFDKVHKVTVMSTEASQWVDLSSMDGRLYVEKRTESQKRKKRKVNRDALDSAIERDVPYGRKNYKYWLQRYVLFSLYDKGIQMDEEGWYSVTPEPLAQHTATRVPCDVIIDAFCGVGGNSIQLAKTCKFVIAIDLNPDRIRCAKRNAEIYGVAHKIQFIVGNYLSLIPKLKADTVFLSPPWGGPEYTQQQEYDINSIKLDSPSGQIVTGTDLFVQTLKITDNIVYYLPKNTNTQQLANLASYTKDRVCEIEKNVLNGKLRTVSVYFGKLCQR